MLVFNRNTKNENVNTLTLEQHNVLKWLCGIVHVFEHCETCHLMDVRHNNFLFLSHFNDDWSDKCVNYNLANVSLAIIDYDCCPVNDLPCDWDYSSISAVEQEILEQRASSMCISAFELWHRKTELIFEEYRKQITDSIRNYLKEIDRDHGTDYVSYSYNPFAYEDYYDIVNCKSLFTPLYWFPNRQNEE